jgi:hypothetical protein
MIGGQSFTGGTIREYLMTTNNSAAIYNGDLVQLGAAAAGQPTVVTSTPTTSSVGIVGVCVGVRYQLAGQQLGYPLFAQYLPANAVTAGYTNIFIRVVEDPDQLYQVQSLGSIGYGSIGKTIALANFTGGTSSSTGNTTSGNSVVALSATVANIPNKPLAVTPGNVESTSRISTVSNRSSIFHGAMRLRSSSAVGAGAPLPPRQVIASSPLFVINGI